MENKTGNRLETDSVSRLMCRYAIPCIISLVVAALYNIVDQLFIANADYLGSQGNAANTVVFPLTVVALAIAVCIGDGACAFVSIALGSSRKEDAHRCVGNAIVLVSIAGFILMAIYLIFMNQILTAFGGRVNDETFGFAGEYFLWITLGIPAYMFGQAMNPIIRADGSPRFAMISTVSGAVLNCILDPVFIYGFRWGMAGAAVATILGQFLTCGLSIWYLTNMKETKLERASFVLNLKIDARFVTLGITSFLSQISLVAAMAAINNMLRKYGAADPVYGQTEYSQIPMAVVGIVMKFFQIVISIAVGMAAGCIPIVGYNTGAGRSDRVKSLFTRLLVSEAAVGAAATLVAVIFPEQIIDLFGAAHESAYYTDFAIHSFRIYLCTMTLATVNKGCFIYLQAMGKAAESTAISMIREIVFGVGFAIILPGLIGLDGVLYSMPVSDILTFVIAAIICTGNYRRLDSSIKVLKAQATR
ncbi:MAG: MATE family efflux transporter [Mageeibacillus sp.]|jgi:putative MATE family efflux protein|nr:MATE family efflux transporter [Mageeibacillus sp.]MCI1264588.1 MATE family efflux transporter [Saccharofermentans sp.]MCI2044814.1 MATE family efflux transporter [Mageeibacillus sp.]